MVVQNRTYTADDLWALSHRSASRLELSEGELSEMSPAGGKHGWLAHRFALRIGNFVEAHDAGYVTAAETGYILHKNPNGRDTVRAPDVGFISKTRLPEGLPDQYIPYPPELAVEIVSPNDEAVEVEAKLNDYLKYGVRLIVFCYPKTQTLHVYRGNNHQVLHLDDTLDVGDILPGFTISVRDIFGLE
ncbi:MAG: Uma2 family endonuclease [Anaerolineae bacterium]|nr:Uma2 family endonuclease [Anaerolineae bacterium]